MIKFIVSCLLLLAVVSSAGLFILGLTVPQLPTSAAGFFDNTRAFFDRLTITETEKSTVVFVGDIMLARNVEQLMIREGGGYPFALFEELSPYAAIVGNFEASVPKAHTPTPVRQLAFSVPSTSLPYLYQAPVTHVSLANNHTDDFGSTSYKDTLRALDEVGFNTFGRPDAVSRGSVSYIQLDEGVLGLIGIHTLGQELDFEVIGEQVEVLRAASDITVAYVHWGEEYAPTHSQRQREVAETLVNLGVDLIIGHHPHVVQDIEIYKGSLIFYSLGNFIFDQYFSDEVQHGLWLELTFSDDERSVRLRPVTSVETPSQPQFMSESEAEMFLKDLAQRSDLGLQTQIMTGILSL
ncbi:MAG: CapA family protein [Patescibacteria group bacterium]